MKSFAIAIGLAVAAALAGPARSEEFSKIIVFGDSLSDLANTAGVMEDGYPPRVKGYYKQRRYSDNRIWIERVAKSLGMPQPTPGRGDSTSLRPKPNGTVWAWGGAEAGSGTSLPDGATEPVPALLTQVDEYLKANKPDTEALYAIWSGADNLLVGGNYSTEAASAAASAVIRSMRRLERKGATHFCILNLPDIALTPYARDAGAVVQTIARLYSISFNSYLSAYLKTLEGRKNFDATVYFVDAFTELSLIAVTVDSGYTYSPIFSVPGPAVKIDNVSDIGFEVYEETGTFPPDYLFWSSVHPTTQGHQVIAGKVLEAIK